MVCEDCKIEPIKPITAPAEKLICKRCGSLYVSRGKNDPGMCRVCEQVTGALSGGPLNGMRVYHEDDKKHSGLIEEE